MSQLSQEFAQWAREQTSEHSAGKAVIALFLQRSVLRLTELEGVSMRKAAERLGVAPATVQRARRQGLAGLRQGLVAHSHQSDSAP